MHRYQLTVASAALAAGFQLLSTSALAHIELQAPLNRYSDIKAGDNKSCPCGSGTTNRSCKKPEEFADPDRAADRATTFAPGDTITVRFDEYVGHGGRYRIAFDPDGASLDAFNENILLDEPDPAGNVGNIGEKSLWEFQVTLPNMTCDNCTLQLIQVMDGNTVDPVLNPVDRGGTYFQCADIVLANGTPKGGVPPADPTDHPGNKGQQELARTPAAAPDMTMTMPTASSATSSGTPMGSKTATDNSVKPAVMDAASEDDGGGCSVARAGSAQTLPSLTLLAGALLGVGLRSRRRKAR
jgi:hypothetical protein